jgi:hypothetical protein
VSRAVKSPWKSIGGVMTVSAYTGVILGLFVRMAQPADAMAFTLGFMPVVYGIAHFFLWPVTVRLVRTMLGTEDDWPPLCPNCRTRTLRPIYRVGRRALKAVGYKCSLCRCRVGIGLDGELVVEKPASRGQDLHPTTPPAGEIQFLGEVAPYVPSRANIPIRSVSAGSPTARKETGPAGSSDDPILL